MIDAVLLLLVLAAAAAAGLTVLDLCGALPEEESEYLVPGTAVGLGLAGIAALGLAAVGALRPLPLAALGVAALATGLPRLRRALAATDGRGVLHAWPWLAVCALVLVAELPAMLAPPVGGDQTKYHLVYPRLYAERGGLVSTPWSMWGQMQFVVNFVFALGFALRGDVLARFLNGAIGVLAALALAGLTRRHLARGAGAIAGALFFTLPLTWSQMTRVGADLALVLYGALAVAALLDWVKTERPADLRRAGLVAGLAAATKTMGLLLPMLVGIAVIAVALRRARPLARVGAMAVGFGALVIVAGSPFYVRNAIETGNPLYPFGYNVFGGRHWSAAASEYLADYYRQYRTVYSARRGGVPYAGLSVARFPWDLTMHPESFENAARQSLDIGPFALAFAPAVLLVRRRRLAVLLTAGLGLAYAGTIAGAAWAHPRYVVPGIALLLVAAIPAARTLLGARLFPVVIALTIAGNLALVSRLLRPLWVDQTRVALGRLAPDEFLRRHSARFAFWERANAAVPASGRILVLEKIPHPYYIERSFVLGSYLEQGLINYRAVATPDGLVAIAKELGVTHVAVDLTALDSAGDPFEAAVARLWRGFVATGCEPILRQGTYALYVLRAPTAYAAAGMCPRG